MRARHQDYAEALAALGRAAGELPRLERDMTAVLDTVQASEELRRFMADPFVKDEGKCAALAELFGGQIHGALLRFLQVLEEAGAFSELSAVAEAFFQLTSSSRESLSGEIVSAVPLADATLAAIEAETGVALGKRVQLRPRVDSSLLGGVLVRVGDWVLDGTVDHQLEAIRGGLLV